MKYGSIMRLHFGEIYNFVLSHHKHDGSKHAKNDAQQVLPMESYNISQLGLQKLFDGDLELTVCIINSPCSPFVFVPAKCPRNQKYTRFGVIALTRCPHLPASESFRIPK